MKNEQMARLLELLGEITDIHGAAAVLAWDQETYMPSDGAHGRSKQMATLEKIAHAKFTSAEIGKLLDSVNLDSADYQSFESSLLRVVRRNYEREVKLPSRLVGEIAETQGISTHSWIKAKQDDDFTAFRPYLEKLVGLAQEKAECLGYEDSPYDALLFEFEPGMKTSQITEVFSDLKSQLVPFVHRIVEEGRAVNNDFMFRSYPVDKQWELSLELLKILDYNMECGRLDKAEHPFTMGIHPADVRLTTHLYECDLASAIFSTVHEYGHGMYEQGIPPELARTPLGTGATSGVHESQSRMWENVVGRSREFWSFAYPLVQRYFPDQLGSVGQEEFYRGINKVQPSLIRVDADEVTYNLHIFLRFEIEKGLIEGKIKVADLPELWRVKMKEYVGVVPESDSQGILQDIHWSAGMFGYFPTYTLGNILSVQLYNKALAERPELPAEYMKGKFTGLKSWLNSNVHVHGAKFTLPELVQIMLNEPFSAEPYMNYIGQKYGEIYF